MDYEKKYKEALSRARQFSEHPLQENSDSIVEYIFPELKESEDEKIRKALIRFHKSTIDIDGIKGADVIAWLEKQGRRNNDEMLQAISIGLSDIKEDVGWSDFGGTPIEEIQEWLKKQGEQKPQRMISAEAKEAMYDKPAWSKEDEQHIDSLLKRLDGLCRNEFERTRFAISEDRDWLTSLKERIE